ncbi:MULTISPECIES: DUF5753 domain-containing protein [Thermomonosporaceae]|uniref:DUF5753 domain-containing protein n=1 Tax=Thermomonosporaceae TaxID=2012 RepID=UPI00255AF439|nr:MULTISPECIES: DUF5753 domain-containing protein [Thermomonosporaceae]MDL4775619.1 DUF5753 domain-containing protein [Actinomadura xylanilytica]
MIRKRDPLDPKISIWHFLAYALRFEREHHDQSLAQCGQIINAARSTVSNMEAGRLKLHEDQARLLDAKYNTPRLFELLIWFAQTGHDPDWFRQYTQYEANARVIRIYQGQVIPVPLQIEEYARSFISLGDAEDIEAAVAARMTRQKGLLSRSRGPLLIILLDEDALHRMIGGPVVMKNQFQRLLDLENEPNVILRVIPRDAGVHIGLNGPFQVMSLERRDIAYIGAFHGGRLVEVTSEVQELSMDFERIGAKALDEVASRALIAKLMEEYT